MSEEAMQHWLSDAIVFRAQEENAGIDIMSFATAGVLTSNKGLLVRFRGSEFQIEIVKTR